MAMGIHRTSIFRRLASAFALVLLGIPVGCLAREKRPSATTKAVGLVTAVDSAHLSILVGEQDVTLTTQEDFTEKVGPGARVTAWYSSKSGVNTLDWLEYPRETFALPPEQLRSQVRKVIILPNSQVPDADRLFEQIAKYVESNFGWYVAPRALAEEVRDRTLKVSSRSVDASRSPSALDSIDPETGEFDIGRYTEGKVEPKERGQAEARPRAAAGATSSAARPASTLDAIDPATGEFDMARYLQAPTQTRAGARSAPASPGPGPAPGSLIPTVAAETHVDAVLEADVVEVQAPLHRLVASWDGVEEPIAGKGSETIAKLFVLPVRGVVPASTLVLKLWDSRGNLMWSNRSGFAVLAVKEGMGNKLRERPLPEVLRNTAGVDRWLATVFASWASTPEPDAGATVR